MDAPPVITVVTGRCHSSRWPDADLLDQSDRVRVAPEEVVVEPFEPAIRRDLEAAARPPGNRVPLQHRDVVAPLREPQRDRQPEHASTDDAVSHRRMVQARCAAHLNRKSYGSA